MSEHNPSIEKRASQEAEFLVPDNAFEGMSQEQLENVISDYLEKAPGREIWIGNLDAQRQNGNLIQGRDITRRAVVDSWQGVIDNINELPQMETKDDGVDDQGDEWSSRTTGLLITPFKKVEEKRQEDDVDFKIVVDSANREKGQVVAYKPTSDQENRGLQGVGDYGDVE